MSPWQPVLNAAGLLLCTTIASAATRASAELLGVPLHGRGVPLRSHISAEARVSVSVEVQDEQGHEEGGKFSCAGDAALSGFAATISSEQYYWANKNGDALASGASRFKAPPSLSAGPAWTFKDENATVMSSVPVIDQNRDIYVSNRNGKLRKFGPDGALKWTNADDFGTVTGGFIVGDPQFSQVVTGGPVIMDGAVCTGVTDGTIHCVDMASGETRWRQKVAARSGMDAWSLTGRSGVILAAVNDDMGRDGEAPDNNQIVALDGSSGQVLWRWLVPNGSKIYNWLGSFADSPPSVLFATSRGRPYRVRLCDGKTVWEGPDFSGNPGEESAFSTGGMAMGPNGLAYVTSNVGRGDKIRGRLSAYDVASGKLMWRQEQAMPANNAPSIGRLAVGSPRLSVVVALGQNPAMPDDEAEKSGKWKDGSPVAWHTEVRAFDATTGEPLAWSFTPPVHRKPQAEGDRRPYHICLPDAWSNGAIDARGTYFVGHMSGNIFALRDVNGDGTLSTDKDAGEVTMYYGGRCHQASPAIAPGLLVAAPCDGLEVFTDPASQ